MGQGAVLAGALACGFAGGCLAWFVCGGTAGPGTSDERRGGAAGPAEVARLEARIDALAATVRSARSGDSGRARLRDAPSARDPESPRAASEDAPSPGGDGGPAAPETASAADAFRALETRIAALERGGRPGAAIPEDLSKLSPPELLALARNLQSEKRFGDQLRVADLAARRGDLDADQRTEAELNAGYALRSLGRHADAETRFRDTLARVGEASAKGAEILFQVAWERYYQKDVAGASAAMERCANHPDASPVLQVHGLYNGGRFAIEAGDAARGRGLLERLLRDRAADIPASQAFLRTEAERLLKDAEGK